MNFDQTDSLSFPCSCFFETLGFPYKIPFEYFPQTLQLWFDELKKILTSKKMKQSQLSDESEH